jgi:site-specific recombinase XerD
MTLRPGQTAPPIDEPPWLASFIESLARADLAPATRRGYRYDLRHFLGWQATIRGRPLELEVLTELDLVGYRQAMIAAGLRPATVNRRLDALRRLCRWARDSRSLAGDIAHDIRPVRRVRNCQPVGLTDAEVHALLRAAGTSTHGLARRNYALVQVMVQVGLRVGEVSALRVSDLVLRDRTGSVRVRHGKGLKDREVPLNATARRALRQHLELRPGAGAQDPVFLSGRQGAMPVRSIQAVITALVRRARLTRVPVSAHTLRHTFALNYLRDNPGKLVELACLLGHESLDTTAIYTRPSHDDLAADLERSHLNVDR